MARTMSEKLRIRENYILKTINMPPGFAEELGPLPKGVKILPASPAPDQIHWFVKDRKQMEDQLEKVLPFIKDNVVLWIYYPKGSSKMQTDLTRDKGWDKIMEYEFQWLSLISFNDTWSAFSLRSKSETEKKKETAAPKEQEVFKYVDPKTKTVRLPEDLSAALEKAKKEKIFFNELSFTNKKEYIEWIVSAKKEETRSGRIKDTLVRLGRGWKNPANR